LRPAQIRDFKMLQISNLGKNVANSISKNVVSLKKRKIFSIILITALFALMTMDVFSQELEKVRGFKNGYYGYWGYVDKATRKTIIPCEYVLAKDFSEGLAAVERSYLFWGFIDKTGREVIPFNYNRVKSFSEGLAAVKLNGKWGFIDKTGKVVIPFKFQRAESFSEGLAAVKFKGNRVFIDKMWQDTTSSIVDIAKSDLERERKAEQERERITAQEKIVALETEPEKEKTKQKVKSSGTNTKNANTTNKIFRFGVRAGMNVTNMSGFEKTTKMVLGVQSGVVVDFSLPKNFAIQTGLLYAQQGFKWTGTYMGKKSTTRYTLHYIQIPINAQYKLNLGSKTSLLFQTGPYFGYCFLGKAKNGGTTKKIPMGFGKKDELKTFDFGLGVGVGVQFYGLQAGIGYNIGLYNLSPLDEKHRNHGLAITITYLFGKYRNAKE